MRQRIATLAAALDGKAPTEWRLFAAGEIRTTKGTFYFTEESARLVMAAAEAWGNEFSSDYEHAAASGPNAAEGAPASSWYDLEIRQTSAGPELWATNIQWTDRARQMIEAGEYRYISPTFYYDSAGQITGYLNFALTNLPATIGMDQLIAASMTFPAAARARIAKLGISIDQLVQDLLAQIEPTLTVDWIEELQTDAIVIESSSAFYRFTYTLNSSTGHPTITGGPESVRREWIPVPPAQEGAARMNRLMAKLGLQAEANEDAGIAALDRIQKDRDDAVAALTAVKALVPDGQDIIGTVTGWRDGAQRVEQLSQELEQLKGERSSERVKALLDQGEADGKLTPASREALTKALADTNGHVDPARIEAYLASAPKVVPGSSHGPSEPTGGAPAGAGRVDTRGKTWEQLSNVERHNLAVQDPEEFRRLRTEAQASN